MCICVFKYIRFCSSEFAHLPVNDKTLKSCSSSGGVVLQRVWVGIFHLIVKLELMLMMLLLFMMMMMKVKRIMGKRRGQEETLLFTF